MAKPSAAAIPILPIRHHSPNLARAVAAYLRERRPRLVLIEGPEDLTPLIPLLLAEGTRPPVAALGYLPAGRDQAPRSLLIPFCAYSPEYVALQVAQEIGAEARFIDLPTSGFLTFASGTAPSGETESADAGAAVDATPALSEADTLGPVLRELAERFGCAGPDEFWDQYFEMAPPASLLAQTGAYGDLVRALQPRLSADAETRAREAHMAAALAAVLKQGFQPDAIAVVCGAAHAEALRLGPPPVDLKWLKKLEAARLALIPFSEPRLAEQSGYGAGNRAPAYYQLVWQADGDFAAATEQLLLRLRADLAGHGFAVSLGDAIEANRLARTLAGLRGKPLPGVEELRDAATACFGQGGPELQSRLTTLLIGNAVGTVAETVERTSLQQEFDDTAKRLGVPIPPERREYRLDLTLAQDIARSTFLQRLVLAAIPFARLTRLGSALRPLAAEDGYRQLGTLRERWELVWSPATDAALIERTLEGNTLVEVCDRRLRGRLQAARTSDMVASVLLASVVCDLPALAEQSLRACEAATAVDDDLASLARAAHDLDQLVRYRGARPGQTETYASLLARVRARAALLLPASANVADAVAPALADALKTLHTLARRHADRASGLLAERLARTVEDANAHPLLAGLAATLLFLDGQLSLAELVRQLKLHLSRAEDPTQAAGFVEGLFALNRGVLVRSRPIVDGLTAFLLGLDPDAFGRTLPLLRRALSGLSPAELTYLRETIAAGLAGAPPGSGAVPALALGPAELEQIAAADAEVARLFDPAAVDGASR